MFRNNIEIAEIMWTLVSFRIADRLLFNDFYDAVRYIIENNLFIVFLKYVIEKLTQYSRPKTHYSTDNPQKFK